MNTNIRTMTIAELETHSLKLVEAQVLAQPGKDRIYAVNATRAAWSELKRRTHVSRVSFLRLQAD